MTRTRRRARLPMLQACLDWMSTARASRSRDLAARRIRLRVSRRAPPRRCRGTKARRPHSDCDERRPSTPRLPRPPLVAGRRSDACGASFSLPFSARSASARSSSLWRSPPASACRSPADDSLSFARVSRLAHPEEDPRCSRLAVCERPAPHRPCGGLRSAVGHVRPLPPAPRERRAHGQRDRRARYARHGRRGRGGRVAA